MQPRNTCQSSIRMVKWLSDTFFLVCLPNSGPAFIFSHFGRLVTEIFISQLSVAQGACVSCKSFCLRDVYTIHSLSIRLSLVYKGTLLALSSCFFWELAKNQHSNSCGTLFNFHLLSTRKSTMTSRGAKLKQLWYSCITCMAC